MVIIRNRFAAIKKGTFLYSRHGQLKRVIKNHVNVLGGKFDLFCHI